VSVLVVAELDLGESDLAVPLDVTRAAGLGHHSFPNPFGHSGSGESAPNRAILAGGDRNIPPKQSLTIRIDKGII